MNKLFIICSIILLMASCASGPKYSEQTNIDTHDLNTAILYIYRPSKYFGWSGSPTILKNGTRLGKLKNGGFSRIKLNPGIHTIAAKWAWANKPFGTENSEIEYTFKAGETYYLKYSVSDTKLEATGTTVVPLVTTGAFIFEIMQNDIAKTELQKLKSNKW